MKAIELLGQLSGLPNETLEQEVLFEVNVNNADGSILQGAVSANDVVIVASDHFLTPNGTMNHQQAEEQYMEVQVEAALGNASENDLHDVALDNCHLLVAKDQLLFRLQEINVTSSVSQPEEIESDISDLPPGFAYSNEKPDWLAHADKAFGPPVDLDNPDEAPFANIGPFIPSTEPDERPDGPLDYWLTPPQIKFMHRVLDEWETLKGSELNDQEKYERDYLKESITY